MRIAGLHRLWCCTLFLMSSPALAAATDAFTTAEFSAIEKFLSNNITGTNSAMVVGLVDENGSHIFSAGTLDNGTEHKPDGDSLFLIGSVSKTFTTLLLLEMASRGEVNLDDPLAKFLPKSVDVPTYQDRQITLIDLATHTAGLPANPSNMVGADVREKYETYNVDKILEFLEGFKLQRAPGSEYEYSNVGMALLGSALERRGGRSYEALIQERICRPLGMHSTCAPLTPELVARRAMGHEKDGRPSPPWKLQVYLPAGGIHSTANDLLKYLSAQAGLKQSTLTPLIERSHEFRSADRGIGGGDSSLLMGRTTLPWMDRGAVQPEGMELLGHAGGAGSYHAWAGFDKRQRRGVVALTTANDFSLEAVGWTILQRLPLTEERKQMFARELVGIGVVLELADEPTRLRVARVLPQTPAAAGGLVPGEVIMMIGEASTAGKTLKECADLLRGPVGSKVRLEILDAERNAARTVELTRERFKT